MTSSEHISISYDIEGAKKPENVAIANALQFEAARATPALSGFNYDTMPSFTSLNPSITVL